MPLETNGRNGMTAKIVGTIVGLALAGAAAMLRGQINDLRDELRSIATTQQARGERLTSAEAKAATNSARLDRLDMLMDKWVLANQQKVDVLEERLRKIEQKK